MTGSRCWWTATGWPSSGSGRWPPRCSGAMSSSTAQEQRVFRAVSVLPGPFTLDGAEAVAGPAACQTVPRLVDCSLLVPPRAGPDGRTRYTMLKYLPAYGAGLLAEAGEGDQAAAALAGYVAELAEGPSAGLHTHTQEVASLRLFDAEETSMHHALAWAMEHDPDLALRLALTQSQWWLLRGRLTSQAPLLAAAAEHADVGSNEWCTARMLLGQAACQLAEPDAAVEHYTTVRDALERTHRRTDPVGLLLMTLCLAGLSAARLQMGRVAEAAEDARQAMDVARQTGYQGLEAIALTCLGTVAWRAGDRATRSGSCGRAGGLGRLRGRAAPGPQPVRDDDHDRDRRPGRRRAGLRGRADLVAGSGRSDEPERPALEQGVPGLAGQSHRQHETAHLRELLQIGMQTGLRPIILVSLDCCGHLCAATGRPAEAITAWAAASALSGPWPLLVDTRNLAERERTPAERQGTARPGRGPGGRGTRRGHEPAHRRQVRSPARSGPAASRATHNRRPRLCRVTMSWAISAFGLLGFSPT